MSLTKTKASGIARKKLEEVKAFIDEQMGVIESDIKNAEEDESTDDMESTQGDLENLSDELSSKLAEFDEIFSE